MWTNWMLEHFTEDEIERMSAFTETPSYKRDPEQLLPDDADSDGETDGPRAETERSRDGTESPRNGASQPR